MAFIQKLFPGAKFSRQNSRKLTSGEIKTEYVSVFTIFLFIPGESYSFCPTLFEKCHENVTGPYRKFTDKISYLLTR